jgi:SAM-dependent methyltransferase
MAETDYILGTNDQEIDRLQLQHSVWRERVLDCWHRAGIGPGQTVIDLGCGPGFAALDLAAIVGPVGQVKAYERSERFLSYLAATTRQQGIENIERIAIDIERDGFPISKVDAIWCRWVLCFLSDPATLIERLFQAIRPGGVAVFHEYLDYSTWQMAPGQPAFSQFVDAVMSSWRTSGGDPNVGLQLPSMLHNCGFEIIHASPIVDVVTPADFTWAWPEAFLRTNASRLIELGEISFDEAQEAIAAFETVKAMPTGRMVTPIVLEIIARRP